MADAVVIGAGIGGLATAIRLARLGHRVTVCEQAETVGGKLGVLVRDGYRFDTGPSLVTLPHLLTELLGDGALPLRRLDPVARYRFGDGTWFDAPAGESAMEAAVEALRPGNGADWRRFYARAGRIWDVSHGPFLESPLHGARTLLAQAHRLGDLRTIAPHRTLRALARGYLRDPRLVTFVDRYATYSGSDPRRAPAALASVPYAERHYGAWYVEGGLRRIAEELVSQALTAGVAVRTDADVVRVLLAGGCVDGVELAGGERIAAPIVVANADAAHLYGDLVRHRRAARRVARTEASSSGFVVCAAVTRPTGLAHHNVLFPQDYDAEFDALFGARSRPVADPTIYVNVPQDPAVAPPGCEAWFVLVNAPNHRDGSGGRGARTGVDWDEPGRAEAYADRLFAILAARGVDVRGDLAFREVFTPADLERRTRAVGGAIYGTSSNGVRASFLRPANRSPVPGLFLVGGSSHPGGGIPLVLLSARIVAGLIGPV